jgi:hypothetical protein
MPHALLADLVVLVHAGFILFAVLGGLLVLWWRRILWLHVPAALWAMLVELFGWVCPLTPLEIALRRAGGGPGYESTFVGHYLLPLIYPASLTREVQLTLAALVLTLNGGIYALVWHRHWRRPGRTNGPRARA